MAHPVREAVEAGELDKYFARAQRMLGATEYPPPGFPALLKQEALERSHGSLGSARSFKRPLINVNFNEGVNAFGVYQRACQLCGDCVSGCNYGAKNTVLMNYLPEARRHGAELFTETSVRSVAREGSEWVVRFDLASSGRRSFSAPALSVRAGIVVLAAGTLGSTEILLRSRSKDLRFSERLGYGFTGNGDVFALAYNGTAPIDGVGAGARRPDLHQQVGPCITGMIDFRYGEPDKQMIIEEGSIPGALGGVVPLLLAVASVLWGRPAAAPGGRSVVEQVTRWSRYLAGAYHGATRRTQTLLAMAHDDAGGRMDLDAVHDRLRVEWNGVESQPIFDRIDEKLQEVSQGLQATHIANPFRLITVHPLGGCCMGQNADSGVVDHDGQVFQGAPNEGVHHKGLYVCDGSIIPRSLGANPLLTIAALAERTCELLLSQKGAAPPKPAMMAPAIPTLKPMFYERAKPGIEFTERMSGSFAWVANARPAEPVDGPAPWCDALRPPAKHHELTMDLTIVAEDVEAMVSTRDHDAQIVGTVTAPALSATPMQVREGRFHLFKLAPEHVETRLLRYGMRVETASAAGRPTTYYLQGDKVAHNHRMASLWPELSTLYLTIRTDDAIVGRGVLRLSGADFLRQLTTMRARRAQGLSERFDAHVRFVGFFLGMLRSLYGRRLARPSLSTIDAPPRPRRAQPATSTHAVTTSDGTVINLTRHHGGEQGAVLLSPGFSVRASSFAADTVDENLVEYLVRAKYDVWLLDYRASSGFAAAGTDFSIDDVAGRDYPAAVDFILREANAKRMQIVAHCVGSMALLMSLLGGKLDGGCLRSIVCSQLGLHPIAPAFAELKAAVYAASFLRHFGVKRLTAQYDPYSLWHRLCNWLLTLYPTDERCNNPTCRRILLLFGESFRHDQLNTVTHDAMHEWFGTTSVPALAHLAMMLRVGHVVDKDGRDAYRPHLERLALPISFIHGTRNREFLPGATIKTYEVLCRKNGPAWYVWRPLERYGHMDCFIGKQAAADVFPVVLEELEEGPRRGPPGRGPR